MEEYREMYYAMVRASEDAINILVKAQRRCEEMYLTAEETEPGEHDNETGTPNV